MWERYILRGEKSLCPEQEDVEKLSMFRNSEQKSVVGVLSIQGRANGKVTRKVGWDRTVKYICLQVKEFYFILVNGESAMFFK